MAAQFNQDIEKKIVDVVDDFHKIVFRLIKISKTIEPNNVEIEWLQNKLSLARRIDPLLIIDKCKKKMWTYREKIMDRDHDFFMGENFSEFIKDDENKSFMYTLIGVIKFRFMELSQPERDHIWTLINDMLICVIKYLQFEKEKNQ